MDHLKLRELRTLVRRQCARSPVTRPNVCFYYNSKKGCSKGLRCNALHVCRNFIFGQCKFGDNCNRGHDLIDPSIIFILDQYGIDVEDLPELMQDAQHEMKPPPLPGILGPVPSSLPTSTSIVGWGGPATQLSDHGAETRPSDQQQACLDEDGETSGFGRPGSGVGREGEGSRSGKPSPRVGTDDGGHRSKRPPYGRDSQSPQFKGHRTWSRERGSRSGQDSDSSRSRRGSNSPMPGLMSPPSNRNHGNWSYHVSSVATEKQGAEGCTPKVYQTLFSRRRGHVVNSDGVEDTSLDTAQSKENCDSSEAEETLPTPFNPFSYLQNPKKPAVTATTHAETAMKVSSQLPENVAVAQSWVQFQNTQTSVGAPAIHTTQVKNTTQGVETSAEAPAIHTTQVKNTTQGVETSVEAPAIHTTQVKNTTQGMETSVEAPAIHTTQVKNTTQGMETSVEAAAINTTQGMKTKCHFPARRATEDLLFGRPKERSFLPASDSDGSFCRARAAVRPVVSVMPQVQTKPQPVCSKPDLPSSKVVDAPESCVGVVFGQKQAQDFTPAKTDEQKTSATTNSNVESSGASTSSGVTQPAPLVSNDPSPSTASPLATNLQSIIAGLISNVQKLHSRGPRDAEPESHFVSYLSELAQPDKLTADVKSQVNNEGRMKMTLDDVDGESDNDERVRKSPEQLQYLSDGQISDSENDADAASKKMIPVVPEEPMLFDYNHMPTTAMLSRMLDSPGNSSVKEMTAKSHLGAGEGGGSVRVEEKDLEEADSAAKTDKQGSERKGRSRSDRDKRCKCRCKGKRGARKRRRSGQEIKAGGIEYDNVDSPEEEELELIDSSEGDMSDHHSCDEHEKAVSDRISQGDNSQDRGVHSARQSSAPRSNHSPQRSSQGHGRSSPGPRKTSQRLSPDQRSAHSDGVNRGEYNGSGFTERRSLFRSVSSPTREDSRPHENMFDSGVTSRAEPPKLTALRWRSRSQERSQERSLGSLNGSQRPFNEDARGPTSQRMWQQQTDSTHRHYASVSRGGSLGGGSEGYVRRREELRQANVTDTLTSREGSFDGHRQLGDRPSPFSGEREIENFRIRERSPVGSHHGSLGFRDRSVEGSVHCRLGPSPVPFDHLHTERGYRERDVIPGRYDAGFEDTEHHQHRPADEEPEWCDGVRQGNVRDVSETCGTDAFPIGRGPTVSPKKFANYEDWKRAHSKVSENGTGRSVTQPDILFNSLCSEEERYSRQEPLQDVRDENRHDALFIGQCQDEFQRYLPSNLSPLHEQHNQHEQRREDRHRLDDFQVYRESQPHSSDFSGRSHGPTPPRLHRSEGRDLRAEESCDSSSFDRCRREGFDGGDGGHLRENINHLLDRARHVSGSCRSSPHGDPGSSIPHMMFDVQPPTIELEHDTKDSAPGLCGEDQAKQYFHARKRRGDERQQRHTGSAKRKRISPPREQGRNTTLRDRHTDRHPVHNRDTKSGRRKIRDRDPGHRDTDQVQRDRDPGCRDRDSGHSRDSSSGRQRSRDREITRDEARRRGRNHAQRDEKDTFQRSPRLWSPGNRTGDRKSRCHRSNSGEWYNASHSRQRSVRSGEGNDSRRRDSRDRLEHTPGIKIKMVFNPGEEAAFGDNAVAVENESLPPYRDLDLPGVEDHTGFEGQPLYDAVDEDDEEFHEEGGYDDNYDDNYGDDFGGDCYGNDYGDLEEGYGNYDDGYGDGFGGEFDGDFQEDDLEDVNGGDGTGIGSPFEDVGDLIQARAAHCHPDLRSRLQNRNRSRLLFKAKAEGLQIRVNQGRHRQQQNNKGRYMRDIDRQIIA
ncbi:hypothetical protein V1264_007935 [Littorina saxatilis]|uniref:C3H1-type domain-containing protein n=2 Tax=Littorina saxatilis TaxID=31220 RepID=A0AAN9G546_9CAEN